MGQNRTSCSSPPMCGPKKPRLLPENCAIGRKLMWVTKDEPSVLGHVPVPRSLGFHAISRLPMDPSKNQMRVMGMTEGLKVPGIKP